MWRARGDAGQQGSASDSNESRCGIAYCPQFAKVDFAIGGLKEIIMLVNLSAFSSQSCFSVTRQLSGTKMVLVGTIVFCEYWYIMQCIKNVPISSSFLLSMKQIFNSLQKFT